MTILQLPLLPVFEFHKGLKRKKNLRPIKNKQLYECITVSIPDAVISINFNTWSILISGILRRYHFIASEIHKLNLV